MFFPFHRSGGENRLFYHARAPADRANVTFRRQKSIKRKNLLKMESESGKGFAFCFEMWQIYSCLKKIPRPARGAFVTIF
ncbi:MAG TPA: hypothetical protein DCX19_07605 [Alphaproteobacteria bacterium]|nr:hypothetical protein [Alphaproteobacteria bacterium]